MYREEGSVDAQVRGSGVAGATQKSPSELLAPLDTLCLYRIEDWWTYELCYAKSVRQFHKEGDKARDMQCHCWDACLHVECLHTAFLYAVMTCSCFQRHEVIVTSEMTQRGEHHML